MNSKSAGGYEKKWSRTTEEFKGQRSIPLTGRRSCVEGVTLTAAGWTAGSSGFGSSWALKNIIYIYICSESSWSPLRLQHYSPLSRVFSTKTQTGLYDVGSITWHIWYMMTYSIQHIVYRVQRWEKTLSFWYLVWNYLHSLVESSWEQLAELQLHLVWLQLATIKRFQFLLFIHHKVILWTRCKLRLWRWCPELVCNVNIKRSRSRGL